MKRFFVLIALVAAIAAAAVYLLGVRPRETDDARLERMAKREDTPSVRVSVARKAQRTTEIVFPAGLEPLHDTPIYARTSGYVEKWLADIGDPVKSGQTLALISSPEIDQEWAAAQAGLRQAEAGVGIARIGAQRWKDLAAHNAVSRQELDQKAADLAAREADLKAAQAGVDRLVQLKSFETVTAPYDGVITARNVEVGTLIAAAGQTELFHITQSRTIRVYVRIPQSNVRAVHDGMNVEVLLPEFPGQVFSGKVARHAGALDTGTRTLLTEIQIPNPKGDLMPGMFGQVRLMLPGKGPALLVPAAAVIVRSDGDRVAIVGPGDKIEIKKVKVGRDFGSEVEILDGIAEGARVVANPSDGLSEGTTVKPNAESPADSSNG